MMLFCKNIFTKSIKTKYLKKDHETFKKISFLIVYFSDA